VRVVVDEERDGFARGVFMSVVPEDSTIALLNPVSSRGVAPPNMDDSRGAFVVREGAGVAPPVPLTPSFLLICKVGK
jgi:hypothetical protein